MKELKLLHQFCWFVAFRIALMLKLYVKNLLNPFWGHELPKSLRLMEE